MAEDSRRTSKPSRRPRLGIWALGLVVAAGLGLLIAPFLSECLGAGSRVLPVVARGRLPEGGLASQSVPIAHEDPQDAPGIRCTVPGLPEGVPQADIQHDAMIAEGVQGGVVEKGKYRLVGAYSAREEFGPGRWSLVLDLADEGQGAYYRKMGLSAQSSRILWSARDAVFHLHTICPDPGESLDFGYSVIDGRLHLINSDGTVVVLEPYADSKVGTLPPQSAAGD